MAGRGRSVLLRLGSRMTSSLSRDDVARLLAEPSAQVRATIAEKVAGQLDATSLTRDELALAQDIVQIMARDAATLVREALAANLKASSNLPRDVALHLARDIDSVAMPILEYSEVLADEDLIRLVRTVPESKQAAIARRETLSEAVTDALVETDNRTVVRTVVANKGARIREETLHRVVDRYGADEDIQEPLVQRGRLPVTVTERLVAMVSDRLKDYLVTHHEMSADSASELVLRARERATVNIVKPFTDENALEKLVAQLGRNGRLSPSLILRALCMGDMPFFEYAMAQLAGVPVVNARILIHDPGMQGFKPLYDRARLPAKLFPAFRTAVMVAVQTDFRGADYDRESYSRTMLERILTQCDDLRWDDAEYLLRKLMDLAPPTMHAA